MSEEEYRNIINDIKTSLETVKESRPLISEYISVFEKLWSDDICPYYYVPLKILLLCRGCLWQPAGNI